MDCKNPKAEKKCFKCGKPGHEKKDCPESAKGKQIVKAYALEAVPSSSRAPTAEEKGKGVMLQGTLSINGVSVRVLFDTGASHSFICNELVCRLGLEPEICDRPLIVTNPVGGSSSLCMICRGLVLSSHGCSFMCDCFVLNFAGFGITPAHG